VQVHVINLAEYLYQRSGGNPFYAIRQGIPDLGRIHSHLKFTEKEIEKWLDLMEDALYDFRDIITEHEGQVLLDFMRFQAYYFLTYRRKTEEFMKRSTLF
jgi:truncated hemoglobin YjbI